MKAVLDTSAFLNHSSVDFSQFSKIYTTPSVANEVKDKVSRIVLESLDVLVIEPKKESLEKVYKLVKDLGFLNLLSETDIEVIALALELGDVIVLTDDKSIENILSILKIPFRTVVREPIKKVVKNPKFKCMNCGRINKTRYCSHCGSRCRML